jgi:hypothetical protein
MDVTAVERGVGGGEGALAGTRAVVVGLVEASDEAMEVTRSSFSLRTFFRKDSSSVKQMYSSLPYLL